MKTLSEMFDELSELQQKEIEATASRACPRCILNNKIEGEDVCADCKRDIERGYEALQLAGRCATGFELGKGTQYHMVKIGETVAACGIKPGVRSAGWSSFAVADVTCPRCLKKMEAK